MSRRAFDTLCQKNVLNFPTVGRKSKKTRPSKPALSVTYGTWTSSPSEVRIHIVQHGLALVVALLMMPKIAKNDKLSPAPHTENTAGATLGS